MNNSYIYRENFFLDKILYLIPISIIIGNFAINFITIISSLITILIFINPINLRKYKKKIYFGLFLILLIFINYYNSNYTELSFKNSLGLIKYYLLFLGLIYCMENIKNFKKNFSLIIFISIIFVLIDSYIQYFFGKDIFNYPILNNRLTGPFGSEKVVGSFVSKMFYMSIVYFFLNLEKYKYINIYFLFSFLIIFLSQERAASIMFFFTIFLIIFLGRLKLSIKIFLFFTILTIPILLISSNPQIKKRLISEPIAYYNDNYFKAHFLTAIEIFKSNKFLGSGVKTFRKECSKTKYLDINSKYKGCANHPHNIYFEFLAETGLMGIISIAIINIFIIYNFIKIYIKNFKNRNLTLIYFSMYFILFWPIQTTGSFFSTWNGIFYWLALSYVFSFFNSNKVLNN